MTLQPAYERAKAALLADPSICSANRALFAEFFAYEEYKLTRQNGLPRLDEGCYRTLYGYIQRFRNVNAWFGNTPWADVTKEDIKRVYDGLEDGSIRTRSGGQFQDRSSYYSKVFKSKPFRMAGKAELAREVIEFAIPHSRPVRFLTEDTFRRMVVAATNARHRLLLWLAWDIGENIGTLLQLTKRDFVSQINRYTGEREYLVRLERHKLKRSRRPRSELTLYQETTTLLDELLPGLAPDERFFPFGYRYAGKVLDAIVERTKASTQPTDAPVRWKDLRSGMACHLLRSGWSLDEVNARLGHTPHSDALDAYVNFLALDREKPKERMHRTLCAPRASLIAPVEGSAPRPVDVETILVEVDRLRGLLAAARHSSVAS